MSYICPVYRANISYLTKTKTDKRAPFPEPTTFKINKKYFLAPTGALVAACRPIATFSHPQNLTITSSSSSNADLCQLMLIEVIDAY